VTTEPADIRALHARTWRYIARMVIRRFSRDGCLDMAAALTYWSVLALFPGLVVVVSILALIGKSRQGTEALLDIVRDLAPGMASGITPLLDDISRSRAVGFGLVIGLLAALWSASRYVGGFGRSLNRIYGVEEERPYWMLKPVQVLITLVVVVLAVLVVLGLVFTGPIASSVGHALGIGETPVHIWNVAKWPVLLLFVFLVVGILYWATPNVKQPRFRWISIGAGTAVLLWVAASAGFVVYVANFQHYDRTYGALAGVVILLLWLWITNLALLLGAEIDAEVERGRELQAGIDAADRLQLTERFSRGAARRRIRQQRDDERALALSRRDKT
jgi:membrane protein